MDLRNNQITVAQVLANPEARALLEREFPGLLRHPLLQRAGNMTLAQVLRLASGMIPAQKIQSLLSELQAL